MGGNGYPVKAFFFTTLPTFITPLIAPNYATQAALGKKPQGYIHKIVHKILVRLICNCNLSSQINKCLIFSSPINIYFLSIYYLLQNVCNNQTGVALPPQLSLLYKWCPPPPQKNVFSSNTGLKSKKQHYNNYVFLA